MSAFAQNVWTLDPGHSKVGFTVSHHMISEIDGYFKKYEAKFTASKDDFSDAVFELTVETASLNTENEMRDGHLKGEDLFDVAKFPTLTFKSTAFTKIIGDHYKLTGDLTIKGITQPITLDVWLVGPEKNERGQRLEIGVKAIGKLSRNAFGVGKNLPVMMVSDEVDLRILGEFNKPY
ncbi:MAG: YceI family protein [Saprospiraceae bacterium]